MAAGTLVQERDLRAGVRALRKKSNALAVAILAADILIYVALTWGAIVYRSWGLGTLAGAAIAMLFVAGHDACHGSFTTSRRLNAWIGRIAFLPSLTPFRAWELGHNQTHHVYTNLKPLDYVWMPFSKEEWVRLPWWRRTLERAYRTAPGVGLYYAIEIWGRRLILPTGRRYVADSLLCAGYAAALALVGWKGLLPSVVWPFVCWN